MTIDVGSGVPRNTPGATPAAVGTLYLAAGQVAVAFFGYLMQVSIARTLGADEYGSFTVANNTVYLLILLVTSGIPVAITRRIAAHPAAASAERRLGFRLQLGVGVTAATACALLAGPVAVLLGDPAVEAEVRLLTPAVLAYALLYAQVAYLSGLRLFAYQGATNAVYGVAKVVCIGGLAYLAGLNGALLGVALVPLVSLAFSIAVAPRLSTSGSPRRPTLRPILAFALPVTVLAVLMQLLISLDVFLAKAYIADDRAVGYLAAASAVGRLPYFVLSALGAMLVPTVTHALTVGGVAQARHLVRQATRAVTVVAVGAIVISAAGSEEIMTLLYSTEYAASAPALPVFVGGMCLLALFWILASVQMGAGQERLPALSGLLALVAGGVLGSQLVPSLGLMGAALTNLCLGAVGASLSIFWVARRFGSFWPLATSLRALVAAVPAGTIVALAPSGAGPVLASLVLAGLAYLGMLIWLREFGPDDWQLLGRSRLVLRLRAAFGQN